MFTNHKGQSVIYNNQGSGVSFPLEVWQEYFLKQNISLGNTGMHLSVTFIQTSRESIINTYVCKKYNFDKSQDRLAVGLIYPLFFLPLPLLLLNQTSSHTMICQSPSISNFNSTVSITHSVFDDHVVRLCIKLI